MPTNEDLDKELFGFEQERGTMPPAELVGQEYDICECGQVICGGWKCACDDWSIGKLQSEMRRVGWVRMKGNTPTYQVNGKGKPLTLTNWNSEYQCEEWKVWAAKKQTPPPF